jgi:hypothetical protein
LENLAAAHGYTEKINSLAGSLLKKAPGLAISLFTDSEVLLQRGYGVTNT